MSYHQVMLSCHYLVMIMICCHGNASNCNVIMPCHYATLSCHVSMSCTHAMTSCHIIKSCHCIIILCYHVMSSCHHNMLSCHHIMILYHVFISGQHFMSCHNFMSHSCVIMSNHQVIWVVSQVIKYINGKPWFNRKYQCTTKYVVSLVYQCMFLN